MTHKQKIQDLLYFKGKIQPNKTKLELVDKTSFENIGVIVSVFN